MILSTNEELDDEWKEDEGLRCSKCLFYFSNITKPYLLPCNHNLCLNCIDDLIKEKKCFCPLCKTPFKKEDRNKFKVNFSFLNLVLKILKNKIILCKKCNKVFYWKEHSQNCNQKFFTEINQILIEIKDLCAKSYQIIKYKEKYKNIIEISKLSSYNLINKIMNKLNKIDKKNYNEKISLLLNINLPNFNLDNAKKIILKFLENCQTYQNLFNNKNDYEELINVLKKFGINKKNKKILNLKDYKNVNSKIINEDFDDENDSSEEINGIANEGSIKNILYFNKQNDINNYNNFILDEKNNIAEKKGVLDDILNIIKDDKPPPKIIVGLNGVKILNKNKNTLEDSIDEEIFKKIKAKKAIHKRNNNNDNFFKKIIYKGKSNTNNHNYFSKKLKNISKNKNTNKSNKNLLINSLIENININKQKLINDTEEDEDNLNSNLNNSANLSFKKLSKEEEQMMIVNKLTKNFNIVIDNNNKIKFISNNNIENFSIIKEEIENNSKLNNEKIINDYNLLLENITNNYKQNYQRFFIGFEENTKNIFLFDSRNQKILFKNFQNCIPNYSNLNYSMGLNYDDIDLIYLTGGINLNNNKIYSNLICLRFFSNKLEYKEKLNFNRAFHSSIYFDNKLFLIGGINEKNEILHSCQVFNTKNRKFKFLKQLNQARKCSSICIHNNNYLYVFSGKNNNNILHSIEYLNLKNLEDDWQIFIPDDPGFIWNPGINSQCISAEQNKIFIFGGENNERQFINDCYVFDPIKKVIYKNKDLKVKSTFYGQSCTICNNYLIALAFKNNKNKINGIHIYDLKKYKWIFG